jgi:hypothetical protein
MLVFTLFPKKLKSQERMKSGIWSQPVGFVLVRFAGICFSHRKDVFTFNLQKNTFYKLCTFNTIFKDTAAINCITVQHKKRFIPVNFDGSYAKKVST